MLSHAYKALFPALLETICFTGTLIGIYLGFYSSRIYDPIIGFNMMMLWSVTCAGFASFLGSLFFGKSTSKAIGWKFGANFQIERAFYHLGFAITTMTLYFGHWGLSPMLAIAYLYLLNLFFEICLHLYDIIRYRAYSPYKIFHITTNVVVISYLIYFALSAYYY
jgi:hypothetical protein